jgi:hypothetical protein
MLKEGCTEVHTRSGYKQCMPAHTHVQHTEVARALAAEVRIAAKLRLLQPARKSEDRSAAPAAAVSGA